MKFSADRQEKKGPLGGAYYETYIKVTLTPEEEKVARKQKFLGATLVGGDPEGEGKVVYMLCKAYRITMNDLVAGITAKVGSGSQLGKLASFEDEVREACKDFKSNIEADQFFGSGGSKSEEEF
jgi:hypothetical protein